MSAIVHFVVVYRLGPSPANKPAMFVFEPAANAFSEKLVKN